MSGKRFDQKNYQLQSKIFAKITISYKNYPQLYQKQALCAATSDKF